MVFKGLCFDPLGLRDREQWGSPGRSSVRIPHTMDTDPKPSQAPRPKAFPHRAGCGAPESPQPTPCSCQPREPRGFNYAAFGCLISKAPRGPSWSTAAPAQEGKMALPRDFQESRGAGMGPVPLPGSGQAALQHSRAQGAPTWSQGLSSRLHGATGDCPKPSQRHGH